MPVLLWWIILSVGFTLLLGFLFYGGFVALENFSEAKLQRLSEGRLDKAELIAKISTKPLTKQQQYYQIASWFCQILSFHVPSLIISFYFGFGTTPAMPGVVAVLGYLGALSLLGVVVFLVTVTLPMRMFSDRPERFLFQFYTSSQKLMALFLPFIWVVLTASEVFALFGKRNEASLANSVTEEEIRDMVDASGNIGEIEEQERAMIHKIFDFDEMEVASVMTHRTDIVGIELGDSMQELLHRVLEEGFSRIPVYENDLDNIRGLIFAKDLLSLVGREIDPSLKPASFMRETIFVPEAQKCTDLMKIFKEQKVHMAVIVDDYGGTAGIVSMEDLLEAIVGNIQDEYDEESEPIVALDENSYLLDGSLDLSEVERLFEIKLHVDEDITTLGGLITNTLGHIPNEGETPEITINEVRLRVILAKNNRIERVKATYLVTP